MEKAVKIIMGLNTDGGSEFVITIGKLLRSIENPDGYQKRALLFFDKWYKA